MGPKRTIMPELPIQNANNNNNLIILGNKKKLKKIKYRTQ